MISSQATELSLGGICETNETEDEIVFYDHNISQQETARDFFRRLRQRSSSVRYETSQRRKISPSASPVSSRDMGSVFGLSAEIFPGEGNYPSSHAPTFSTPGKSDCGNLDRGKTLEEQEGKTLETPSKERAVREVNNNAEGTSSINLLDVCRDPKKDILRVSYDRVHESSQELTHVDSAASRKKKNIFTKEKGVSSDEISTDSFSGEETNDTLRVPQKLVEKQSGPGEGKNDEAFQTVFNSWDSYFVSTVLQRPKAQPQNPPPRFSKFRDGRRCLSELYAEAYTFNSSTWKKSSPNADFYLCGVECFRPHR